MQRGPDNTNPIEVPVPELAEPVAQPAGPPRGTREITLPSGALARIIDPVLGRHQRNAVRMIGTDRTNLPYAMIAATTCVDGRDLTMEDVLDMVIADVQVLQIEVMGNGRSSEGGTS